MSEGFWFGLVLVIIPAAVIMGAIATYLWSRGIHRTEAEERERAASMARHPSALGRRTPKAA
jgi:hypothetical protein